MYNSTPPTKYLDGQDKRHVFYEVVLSFLITWELIMPVIAALQEASVHVLAQYEIAQQPMIFTNSTLMMNLKKKKKKIFV